MTDTQILTLAVAVIFPVVAVIYSNSRVGDLSKRIDDAKETLRAEMGRQMAELKSELNVILMRIENKLDHVIETQADHSARLEKLER